MLPFQYSQRLSFFLVCFRHLQSKEASERKMCQMKNVAKIVSIISVDPRLGTTKMVLYPAS